MVLGEGWGGSGGGGGGHSRIYEESRNLDLMPLPLGNSYNTAEQFLGSSGVSRRQPAEHRGTWSSTAASPWPLPKMHHTPQPMQAGARMRGGLPLPLASLCTGRVRFLLLTDPTGGRALAGLSACKILLPGHGSHTRFSLYEPPLQRPVLTIPAKGALSPASCSCHLVPGGGCLASPERGAVTAGTSQREGKARNEGERRRPRSAAAARFVPLVTAAGGVELPG